MKYDITFCDNAKCKNTACERNQENIPNAEIVLRRGIWVGKFEDCKLYTGD